jgi:hypothetical protein
MNSQDIELSSGGWHPADGFSRVARKIASDIDKTTTIYRRFDRLSACNILLLQAEIAELEYDKINTTGRTESGGATMWRWLTKETGESSSKTQRPRIKIGSCCIRERKRRWTWLWRYEAS